MFTSQMTFMYFEDIEKSCKFFEDFLCLKVVFDPGWAKVFQTTQGAFLGAVDISKGSIKPQCHGGMLISLTVEDVSVWYDKAQKYALEDISNIRHFEDLGLKSFFFKGPENYDFELQQFLGNSFKGLF